MVDSAAPGPPLTLPFPTVEVAASNEVQLQRLQRRRLAEVSVEHHEAPGMAP